jgi:hypothetical protein
VFGPRAAIFIGRGGMRLMETIVYGLANLVLSWVSRNMQAYVSKVVSAMGGLDWTPIEQENERFLLVVAVFSETLMVHG